jgi:hypothetical protein
MESLLLGALSYYGNHNKNNDQNNDLNEISNNYNTNLEHNMNNLEKKQAKIIANQKTNEPDFYKQFDSLSFNNLSKPTSENESYMTRSGFNKFLQRDLDFQNGYSEFQNTDMHYGITTKENFVHNNMFPNSSRRDNFINVNSNSRKYENLSGNSSLWKHKQELDPFFDPVKDMSNVYGLPAVSGELTSRYNASLRNNNGNLPFKSEVKVTPGLDGKKSAPYAVHRIDPRNIDELRSETNKKESYLNKPLQVIKKGDLRAVESEITSFKLPSYREITFDELVPNKHDVQGPRKNGDFVHIETARGVNDMNYKGGAYDSRQGKSLDPNTVHFNEAKRENYLNDFTHAINAVNSRPVFTNKESWTNYETDRGTITQEIHASGVHNNNKSNYYKDKNDTAKPTIKQNNIIQDRNLGINGSLEKKTYMMSNDYVLQNTNRQTTNYEDVGNSAPNYKNPNLLYTDKAKQTTKETTENNIYISNAVPIYKNNNILFTDEARQTIKESTIDNILETNIAPTYKNTHLTFTDKAKQTNKETTLENTFILNSAPTFKNIHTNLTDKAKQTNKETTIENTFILNSAPTFKNTHLILTDEAKSTIKQSTIQNNIILNSAPTCKNIHTTYTDQARPTVKQSTIQNRIISNSAPTYKNTHTTYTDEARPTVKQSTIQNIIISNSAPTYKNTHTSLTDLAKPTVKQSTVTTNYILNSAPTYKNTHTTYADEAKPTVKQSTVQNKVVFNSAPTYKNTHLTFADEAKTTIKESTVSTNYILNSAPTYKNTHTTYTDEAKPTVKQSTVQNKVVFNSAPTYKNTHLTYTDEAKSTIKESTVETNYILNSAPTYKNIHKTYTDKAKPTIKESTVITSIITNSAPTMTGSIIQYNDEAKQTIRETTSTLYNGNAMLESSSNYINNEDPAKDTIRQTTENNEYIGIIGGDNNKETYTTYEDEARCTIKESTLTETPIQNVISNVTQAYVKNDEEARPTIKETLLHKAPAGRMYNNNQSNYKSIDDAKPTVKQTTLLENYKGIATHNVDTSRVIDAELNMTINDKRQQTALAARPANRKSDKIRGTINSDTVKFQNKRTLLTGYVSIPGMSSNYSATPFQRTTVCKKTDLNNNFYRIDPVIIETLDKNPLVNDLRHQKNFNFNTGKKN